MSDHFKSFLDPDGKYPSEGLLRVERNAELLFRAQYWALLERTRDVIQLMEPGENGITVIVTREAYEFRLPTVEWTCPGRGPALSSRLWQRVEADAQTPQTLLEKIEAVREARIHETSTCRFCGRRFPPEHRHEEDVCHGCAERHLGIVY